MKNLNNLIWITGLLLLLFSACKKEQPREAEIRVRLEELDADSVAWYASRNGVMAYPLWEWQRTPTGLSGEAIIRVACSGLNQIMIQPALQGKQRTVFLYILPGDLYTVTISTGSTTPFSIEGPDAALQNFVNQFNMRFNSEGPARYSRLEKLYSENRINDLLDHLELGMQPELQILGSLGDPELFQPIRYRAVADHVEFAHLWEFLSVIRDRAALTKPAILGQYNRVVSYPIDPRNSEVTGMMDQVFTEFPINKKNYLLQHDFINVLDAYTWFHAERDSMTLNNQDDEIAAAKKYLDPPLFELFYALKFGKLDLSQPYSAVERRYRHFKELFPESPYLEGIDNMLPLLKSIYQQYAAEDTVAQ